MNFKLTFLIIYMFGEFQQIICKYTYSIKLIDEDFEVAGDSLEKKNRLLQVTKQLFEDISYRYDIQESARFKFEQSNAEYKKVGHINFLEPRLLIKGPRGEKTAWHKTKKVLDKYRKILLRFEHDKFCHEPRDPDFCRKALKDTYFKEEKITFDESLSIGADCRKIFFPVIRKMQTETLKMEYKVCYAQQENEDRSQSVVTVYLRSAFDQPFIGHMKYFVIFAYIQNPLTEEWVKITDPEFSSEKIKFRYEGYLSLK